MTAKTLLLRLKALTKSHTDSELAVNINLDKATISKVFSGVRDQITLKNLQKISDSTDIRIGILAEWWAEPTEAMGVRNYSPRSMKEVETQVNKLIKESAK